MEVYNNDASVDSTMRIIDEECTIQLRDHQNFLNPDIRPVAKMHVAFDDLSYAVCCRKGKPRKILENVTGCFRPGRLTAIIGPSGAGKTTLLRVISTLKSTNVEGSITINNRRWDGDAFRKETCFLPQEFALLPLLTTRETLYIAARLKVRVREPRAFNLIVREIAENLGLTNCLDTMVENLSGGERKRLAIGIEMVTRPGVLLLDEPTSGLDSTSSNQVIGLLHKMTRTGCTIACAVHQPSSRMISQFDDLLVLHNGKSYYCGTWDDVLSTLNTAGYACPQFYNIAEFILEVVTAERGGDLNNLYTISHDKYLKWRTHFQYPGNEMDSTIRTKIDNIANKSKSLSMWQEEKILLSRGMICIKRDNTLTKLRFAAHVVVAFLLGLVFYNSGTDASRVNSNIACIFFVLLFLYFSSSMPAVLLFPIEAAVFLREYLNNWYRLRSYYSAKIMSDLILQILSPSIFIVIAYYMTGQPIERNRFFCTWLICVLTTILGQSSGMLVGVAFNTHKMQKIYKRIKLLVVASKSTGHSRLLRSYPPPYHLVTSLAGSLACYGVKLGVFLIPALNMPMILFAGFFLKFREVTFYLQPLCFVSFFKYAFEGILLAIYDDDRERLPCSAVYCHLRSPNRILKEMDIPTGSYHMTVLALISWIFCLQLSTYLVLKWKAYIAKR